MNATPSDESGWNVTTLKLYFDEKFRNSERSIDQASEELDRRLEEMNEFRSQILTERRGYVGSDKFDALADKLDLRFAQMERFQSRVMGALVLVGVILPIAAALIVYFGQHP